MRRFLLIGLLLVSVWPLALAAADLSALGWMAGDWREGSAEAGDLAQEVWLTPLGNTMAGAFRLMRGGRVVVQEYLLIEEAGGETLLRFRHFNSDYTTWETDAPLAFRLAESAPGRALFVNRSVVPDEPETIEYRLEDGMLVASVTARGEQAGPPLVFRYRNARGD